MKICPHLRKQPDFHCAYPGCHAWPGGAEMHTPTGNYAAQAELGRLGGSLGVLRWGWVCS